MISRFDRCSLQQLQQVQVSLDTNTVVLPQICQWYHRWFDRGNRGDKKKGIDVLYQLMPYCRYVYTNSAIHESFNLLFILFQQLSDEVKTQLTELLSAEQPITIKYQPFSYHCRILQPMPGTFSSKSPFPNGTTLTSAKDQIRCI
jgi:hypothetical protein